MAETAWQVKEVGSALEFAVYVQPRAGRNEIAGLFGSALRVRLAAPPVENAANRALVEFLAAALGVSRSSVSIVSGTRSRRKMLRVEGVAASRLLEIARGSP